MGVEKEARGLCWPEEGLGSWQRRGEQEAVCWDSRFRRESSRQILRPEGSPGHGVRPRETRNSGVDLLGEAVFRIFK